jgi:hypothetical protein
MAQKIRQMNRRQQRKRRDQPRKCFSVYSVLSCSNPLRGRVNSRWHNSRIELAETLSRPGREPPFDGKKSSNGAAKQQKRAGSIRCRWTGRAKVHLRGGVELQQRHRKRKAEALADQFDCSYRNTRFPARHGVSRFFCQNGAFRSIANVAHHTCSFGLASCSTAYGFSFYRKKQ